jgi:hypothetical protein
MPTYEVTFARTVYETCTVRVNAPDQPTASSRLREFETDLDWDGDGDCYDGETEVTEISALRDDEVDYVFGGD